MATKPQIKTKIANAFNEPVPKALDLYTLRNLESQDSLSYRKSLSELEKEARKLRTQTELAKKQLLDELVKLSGLEVDQVVTLAHLRTARANKVIITGFFLSFSSLLGADILHFYYRNLNKDGTPNKRENPRYNYESILSVDWEQTPITQTIKNLHDLCEYFCAETPDQLNRRIYKGTNCGASISLYSGSPGKREKQEWDFTFTHINSSRYGGEACVMIKVRPAHKKSKTYVRLMHAPIEIQRYFNFDSVEDKTLRLLSMVKLSDIGLTWEELSHLDNSEIKWRRWSSLDFGEKDKGSGRWGTLTITVQEGYVEGEAWHNGHDWSDINPDEITGFTIQTIVEGSEVTVDSDLFQFPVSTKEIDSWMQQMEDEASFYWERDNSDWFRLHRDNEIIAYIRNTWGEIVWEEVIGEVPEKIKKLCEKQIESDRPSVGWQVQENTFELGDGWTLSEYVNDTAY